MGFRTDDGEARDSSDDAHTELISFDRYLSLVLEHMEKPFWIMEEVKEAFLIFDKDNNGNLDNLGANK